ncbi:MAG: uridine diphosphate-N-acetylglucosamine-binding protein YvcK [Acidobacteriota bacterium]|nr:uridine diphosphate-N-acetylglucosamine-binding protein YvcK [Acidobacteriota bacterium]MDQ7088871.1 uridine diphosphate-N-acetylglucosamine-binding protein YvcK [Acidobacteriota bacterium]
MIETIHRSLRVVAIGGGTGLPVVLRGFKPLLQGLEDFAPDRLAAVVTVTDDGGSSGRLRDELGMIPPGDIRNCLVALSHNEPLMARLFQARYRSGGDLNGHNAGNLILAALAQEENGNVLRAIRLASEVLNIHGEVYPSSLASVHLVATLQDGRTVEGESKIAGHGGAVSRIRLEPDAPPVTEGVVEIIERADVVVFGPGSLYTSIIPNLLIPDLQRAVRRTGAFRVLVVNAMTEPGETGAFSVADHVRAVHEHAGGDIIDAVLVAADPIPESVLDRYRREGAARVDPNDEVVDSLVPMVVRREVLEITPKVRHDPLLTAGGILAAWNGWKGRAGNRAAAARRVAGAEG